MKRTLCVSCIFGLIAFSASAECVKPAQDILVPSGNFPKADWVKLAAVQWNRIGGVPVPATVEEAEIYKAENRQNLENFIRVAASEGAEIIVTPEFGVTGYPRIGRNFISEEQVKPYVETVPGRTSEYFSRISQELGVYIHVSYAIVDPETNKYFNALVVLNPKGKIETVYKKRNLYDLESGFLKRGDKIGSYVSPAGKVGLMICADCYDTTVINDYREEKIDLLIISACWTTDGAMNAFARAAKELKVYTIGSNASYHPGSGAIDDKGDCQSYINSVGVAYGYAPRLKERPAPHENKVE